MDKGHNNHPQNERCDRTRSMQRFRWCFYEKEEANYELRVWTFCNSKLINYLCTLKFKWINYWLLELLLSTPLKPFGKTDKILGGAGTYIGCLLLFFNLYNVLLVGRFSTRIFRFIKKEILIFHSEVKVVKHSFGAVAIIMIKYKRWYTAKCFGWFPPKVLRT
jgi:hypothetical protein